jgi:hypothetical protein
MKIVFIKTKSSHFVVVKMSHSIIATDRPNVSCPRVITSTGNKSDTGWVYVLSTTY